MLFGRNVGNYLWTTKGRAHQHQNLISVVKWEGASWFGAALLPQAWTHWYYKKDEFLGLQRHLAGELKSMSPPTETQQRMGDPIGQWLKAQQGISNRTASTEENRPSRLIQSESWPQPDQDTKTWPQERDWVHILFPMVCSIKTDHCYCSITVITLCLSAVVTRTIYIFISIFEMWKQCVEKKVHQEISWSWCFIYVRFKLLQYLLLSHEHVERMEEGTLHHSITERVSSICPELSDFLSGTLERKKKTVELLIWRSGWWHGCK